MESTTPPVQFSSVTADVGESIHVVTDQTVTTSVASVNITKTEDGYGITSPIVADAWIRIGDTAKRRDS